MSVGMCFKGDNPLCVGTLSINWVLVFVVWGNTNRVYCVNTHPSTQNAQ